MSFHIPYGWLNNTELKVAIVGCGGGSHFVSKIAMFKRLLDGLAEEEPIATNIGSIDVFDPKDVNEYSLARGVFTKQEIGINKAKALAFRYNTLLGKKLFNAKPFSFNAERVSDYDLIVTAPDQASIRIKIGNAIKHKKNCLWLDIGISSNEGSVMLGEIGQFFGKLPNVLDLTSLEEVNDHEQRKQSCSMRMSIERQFPFVNDVTCGYAISLLSQLILKGKIESNGCILDILTMNCTPILINSDTFKLFGYEQWDDEREQERVC